MGKILNFNNTANNDSWNSLSDNISNLSKKQISDEDKCIIKFLEQNGYKIKDPLNENELLAIKYKLAEDDKFIDCIIGNRYENIENGLSCKTIMIPFFNSISNPLSDEMKSAIAEDYFSKEVKNENMYEV